MRKINKIILHCSASEEGKPLTVSDIDKMHKAKGWKKIGYHFLIDLDGIIHEGRKIEEIGAHVEGSNSDSIGICYVGGLDVKGNPKDTRNDLQKVALIALVKELKEKYPNATVSGHRDHSPDKNGNGIIEPFEWLKSCPCFDVKKEF